MNNPIFITVLVLGIGLCWISSITFFFVKKAEFDSNVLMAHSLGYWYKHLSEVVPKKWVRPIYASAFIGAFLVMTDILWLLVIQIF